MDSFFRFSGELPKHQRKLSIYRKFPHQEIKWKKPNLTGLEKNRKEKYSIILTSKFNRINSNKAELFEGTFFWGDEISDEIS